MFEPILQLQDLRHRFLLIREFCWRSVGADTRFSYFLDAALLGWRASRLIGGWLQGHPNIQYHPRSTPIGRVLLRTHAMLLELPNIGMYRRTRWLHKQLAVVGQNCADIRAVTSCVAINDILGRRQLEIAALLRATAAAAPGAAPAPGVAMAVSASGGEESWPFLSI
jgi:hypothetical protein